MADLTKLGFISVTEPKAGTDGRALQHRVRRMKYNPMYLLDNVKPSMIFDVPRSITVLNGQAVPDTGIITRSGAQKYVVGADGVLSAIPANTLAYDWSSGVRELLLEGQTSNYFLISSGRDYSTIRCTPTRGVAGPDGTLNALRVTTTGEADPIVNGYLPGTTLVPPSGITITFSVWLRVSNANGNALSCRLFSYGNVSAEAPMSTVHALTSQWKRYTHTRTFPSGMVSPGFACRVDPFDGDASTGGNDNPAAGGSIDLACWQVELGPVATSYIPTSGAAVSRPADVAPLWSGAATATAYAWRGVIQNSADWQTIIGATGGAYFQSASGSPTAAFLGGSLDGLGPNTASLHIPGTVGICGGWGPAGRIISMDGDVPRTNTGLVDRSRTSMFISNPTGVQIRQVLRLRELVAWQLPDRPSAAGCQAQARVWS